MQWVSVARPVVWRFWEVVGDKVRCILVATVGWAGSRVRSGSECEWGGLSGELRAVLNG